MTASAQRAERRLAAIFAADVAGYSRLMSQDEAATLRALAGAREIMDGLIAEHRGRIANTAGDSILAEFPSAVDAVQCAVVVQEKLADVSAGEPQDRRLQFRIGIHVGDVVVRGGDLLGDGVNVAARLEGLAEPGGIAISGAAHGYVRKALPLAYSDLGEQHVKNIDEPVRAYAVRAATSAAPASAPKALPLPDKPSIAVLPFTNMSGDTEQEYFADGVVEDIITGLSRERWFFVIARNSSFVYKGRAVDVKQVGRELGVRYVLEGSVRRAGNRVRITCQLIEATTGAHAWAEKYDGCLENIFDLQDQITGRVVGSLIPTLGVAETDRARRTRPEDLTAYDIYLRALSNANSLTPEGISTAISQLQEVLRRDADYSHALALSAWCLFWRKGNAWGSHIEESQLAVDQVNRALVLDPDDPMVLWMAALPLCYINRTHERALELVSRSVALSPSSAMAWASKGWVLTFLGRGDDAIPCFENAERLSPLDPLSWYFHGGIGASHFHERRYEQAIRWYERALRENPGVTGWYRALAAAYAYLGHLDGARHAVGKILETSPGMSVSRWACESPQVGASLEHLLDGLRKAGLPE